MRIARVRRELGEKAADFRTIYDYYRAAGIVPPLQPVERRQTAAYALFFCYVRKIDLWFPQLPDIHKQRAQQWWTAFGQSQGWLT